MAGVIKHNDRQLSAHSESQKIVKLVGKTDRNAGPTVEEFVKAGYDPKGYPPTGFDSKSTPEQIAAAIAAYKPK